MGEEEGHCHRHGHKGQVPVQEKNISIIIMHYFNVDKNKTKHFAQVLTSSVPLVTFPLSLFVLIAVEEI